MKTFAFGLFFFLAFQVAGLAQKFTPLGVWSNEGNEARFEIYKCGDKLCGKILWLKEPNRDGKPKTDVNNPEAKLRNRPLIGMVFIQGFEYDGDYKWDEGSIYDPKTGNTYSSYMKMNSKDEMEVKGYIGISLIGRSQTWQRIQ